MNPKLLNALAIATAVLLDGCTNTADRYTPSTPGSTARQTGLGANPRDRAVADPAPGATAPSEARIR